MINNLNIIQNLTKTIKLYSSILCLFSYLFFSVNSYGSTDYVTSYANSTDSSYVSTNYNNISNSVVNQYNSILNSSVVTGTVDGVVDAYDDVSNFLGGFFTVNPFSPNPLKPNFGKCFDETWSVKQPGSSSAFTPKITVSNRIVIACIGYKGSVTLHGYGQCKFIGLVRVCARNTAPCTNGNDIACSSRSYNYGNTSGSSSDNWSCPGCLYKQSYRVCGFEDPMFPADLTDTKPSSMPFHLKTSVPPDVTGGDQLVMLGAFIFAAGVLIPGLGAGTMLIGAGLMLAGGIMELIEFITSKMNYTVIANHGCVEIPLTPFPPPYCPQIQGFIPQANVLGICQNSPDFQNNSLAPGYQNYLLGQAINSKIGSTYPNKTQVSTLDNQCEIVKSGNLKLYSTFENPIIRLYFFNPLPICSSGYTGKSDVCVKLTGTVTEAANLWYNNFDLIPTCSSSVTTNCISFPSGSAPLSSFMPYYSVNNMSGLGLTTGTATQNVNFASMPSLPSIADSSQPGLDFAGINNSKYLDATPGNLVKLTDFLGVQRVFLIYLQNPGDQVCVAERVDGSTGLQLLDATASSNPDMEIACIPRPTMMSAPTISSCPGSSGDPCSYGASSNILSTCYGSAKCNYRGSTNISSQPRIKVSVGSSSAKTAVIAVDTAVLTDNSSGSSDTKYPKYQPPKTFCAKDDLTDAIAAAGGSGSGITLTNPGTASTNPAPCSIYGLQNFSAYITDKYNQNSDTATSPDQSITPDYKITSFLSAGVQYVNGVYCRGASKICLLGYSDPTKLVVAKVIQSTDSSGNVSSKVSSDIRDRVIPAYSSSATSQTLTSFFDPATNYSSQTSSISRVAIGAQDPATGFYYENSYCTSDPNNSCVPNSALCTADSTKLCAADGATALPSGTIAVATNCSCLDNTVSPSQLSSCSISGCEYSFLTTSANIEVSIGTRDSTGAYAINTLCTSSSDFTCVAPASTTVPYPPTQIECACPDETKCSCSGAYDSVNKKCKITGCEYAFQPDNSSSITDAQYYKKGSITYPISGKDSCPVDSNGLNTTTCYGQREASPLELGLCQSITQPQCPGLSYTNASSSGAANNGYANWPTTSLDASNNLSIQASSCVSGTLQNPAGLPTRSCNFIDSGYETIYADNTSTTTMDGCPKYTIGYGAVVNPCLALPAWWPSQFLAGTRIQGAIFNQFNVNYDYLTKFVPTNNNYSQRNLKPEKWVTTSYNNCKDYRTNFSLTETPRNRTDGDQEMLYITAANWNNILIDNDLRWLFATPSNIATGETYSNYNGCYVYDVTNYISKNTLTINVGLKLCKYNDKISFSLVDLSKNSSKRYTNNAYIMQSNMLDYLNNNGSASSDTTLYNQSGGKYINHGFVIDRTGFASNSFITAPPPSDFVPIQTAEGINVRYSFYNVVKTESSRRAYYNGNASKATITQGCALSVYRGEVNYDNSSDNYPRSTAAGTGSNYYIPLNDNSRATNHGDSVNLSIFANEPDTGQSWKWEDCDLYIDITNYIAGNSAINPSMFLWSSPTKYNACNGSINSSETYYETGQDPDEGDVRSNSNMQYSAP